MEVWEAGITLGFLPCLCIATYVAEKNILGKIFGFKKEVNNKMLIYRLSMTIQCFTCSRVIFTLTFVDRG